MNEELIIQKCMAISGWNELRARYDLIDNVEGSNRATRIITVLIKELKEIYASMDKDKEREMKSVTGWRNG